MQTQSERVRAIMATDLSKFINHANEEMARRGQKPPLSAERAELALKQFYAGSAIREGLACAVSQTLDPFWHSHILHTRDYRTFCDGVVGGFINHNPLDKSNPQEPVRLMALYVETCESLRQQFGDSLVAEAFPELTEANAGEIVVCDWDPPR